MQHLSDEKIINFLENELSSEDRREADKHLSECSICAEKLAEYQLTFSALEKDEVPAVSSAKWATFLPEIYEKLDQPSIWGKILNFFTFESPMAKHIIADVALILLLVFFVTIFHKPAPKSQLPNLENIISQNDEAIEEVEFLIDDTFVDLELEGEISEELLTEGEITTETEETDLSEYVSDALYENVDIIYDMVYENKNMEEILYELSDEEKEKLIEEFQKNSKNKKSA